ncbi:hypothetical protein I0P70_04000 [Pontibacter sp. FD36]|uniref:hypothetical protein n=1 Tax=Pontibacter sp. FD36 TaxID=2789860 RepID=UPI0018AC86FC|nr:hypothetical protein [Pontibacter sp. FD36]MBF8962400.1 hypothetical protein [Pontibacter sp. FD36]
MGFALYGIVENLLADTILAFKLQFWKYDTVKVRDFHDKIMVQNQGHGLYEKGVTGARHPADF